MLIWPDATSVLQALRVWVTEVLRERDDVLRIGYFGSYARGDWGVGSDLDLVVVVEDAPARPEQRGAGWDVSALPVPVDLLIYTAAEWAALDPSTRAGRMLQQETVWVYER